MTIGTITATGLGSGLDIESLVTGLVDAERTPTESRINRDEAETSALISGFGQLSGALSGVQGSVSTLASRDTFTKFSANSDQFDAVRATAGQGAAAGSYSVSVSGLAESQSLASGTFASVDTEVGEGTLSIALGTAAYSGGSPVYSAFSEDSSVDVAISAGSTLSDVRDAINAAEAGVSASIVQDGAGARLLLVADETGLENAIQVSVTDLGDGNDLDNAGLSQFSFNTAVSNMDQTNGAADASFTLNGLSLTSSSNEIENVIDGVSLTLLTTTTAPANVSIAEDRLGITAAVGAFVESYNNYVLVNNGLTGFNSLTGVSGALSGDFSARSIESTVRDSTTRRITGSGSFYDSLATVGITTNADGTLTLDSTRLSAALDDDKEGVVTLFAGSADDSVEGVAERLTATLSATLDSDGLLTSRTDSLNERFDDFADQRIALDRRMASIEARYRAQFNALDILVAQLQSTGDFLETQLASLPFANQNDN